VILTDVNVLVYAHRRDTPNHLHYCEWLESVANSEAGFGLSDLVLSGFLRIVTHPRIFKEPTPLETAARFVTELRDRPNCLIINPGERHWAIFIRLCREVAARGNLVPDAYLAALAIESGSEWITTDRDYARFPAFAGGTRWTDAALRPRSPQRRGTRSVQCWDAGGSSRPPGNSVAL
jgi:toxin-antitoxin system PIN domain toxin